MTGLIILLAILFILALILFQKLTVRVYYRDRLHVRVQIAFFKVYLPRAKGEGEAQKKEREGKREEKEPKEQAKLNDIITSIEELYRPVIKGANHLRKKIVFSRFYLAFKFSSGDPAATALLYGAACAVIFPFVAIFDRLFTLKDRAVQITPVFSEREFIFFFDGIFSIRLANIVLAFLIFVFSYFGQKIKSKFRRKKPLRSE